MIHGSLRLFLAAGAVSLGLALSLASPVRAAGGPIYVLPTSGIVDSIMATYIEEALKRAAADGSPLVIVELNTPGGDLAATQRIVQALLTSPVPTAVWVGPAGAKAASAGTFITLAANFAFMAPGTNIGAASPVGSNGEDITGTLGEKVRNDAIAFIRSIAETRGRNVDWAVATVAEARSSPASEAVALGAVDGIADDLEGVRRALDGRAATMDGQVVPLALRGVPITELPMNPFQGFLHLLSDPNIAFILFTVGFYGLLFELQNPNFVTGILGALAIILAFVGFGSLPLNLAGLVLIGLGILLFVLETTVTSHGLLTVGGLICFALGASALYTAPGNPAAPDVSVALPLLVVMTATTAAFMGLIAVAAYRTRRMRTAPGLVGAAVGAGTVGEVRRPLRPFGSVYAAGEEWTARAVDDATLERGTPVRVVSVDGLTLLVEPISPSSTSQAPPRRAA
jgi:membrane-bound serine protease (ClpP class)